jgi:hypothetical protein
MRRTMGAVDLRVAPLDLRQARYWALMVIPAGGVRSQGFQP